jgi:hypothetical protein
MAVDPSVRIDIAAEFTGKKAFKQADTATQKLTKSVKSLAGGLGLAFGTAAVLNFSKAAVKAFAQDEAAAKRLTRAVDNLGIGFANPAISKYIADLERSAAIADDILRPAFQGLLTTTGSLTQSQKLLNDAITISRASGIDLATVSTDLARGYVGITKGLKKYNTGLTTAEISSMSFAQVLGVILTRSAGAADDYLETTQFRMDSLGIATGNAAEIIGGGLVNAFARIGGGTEATDAAKAIETIAKAIATTTEVAGGLIGVIPNLLSTLKNLPKNILGGVAGLSPNLRPALTKPTPTPVKTPVQLSAEKQAKALAKLEADAIKRQKALIALQNKQTAAAKKAAADQAKLSKAQSIFNLDQIQIEAALKGKISENERLRLELQRAILNEDYDLAAKLQKELEASQRAIGALQGQLQSIKPAANPFDLWIKSLDEIALMLQKLYAGDGGTIRPFISKDTSTMTTNQFVDYAQETADAATLAAIEAEKTAAYAETFAKLMASGSSTFAGLASAVDTKYNYNFGDMSDVIPTGGQTAFSGGSSVTVNVQGSVLDGNDFVDIVNNALLNSQKQGRSQVAAGALP